MIVQLASKATSSEQQREASSREVDRNDSSRRDLANRQLGALERAAGLQPVATALDKGALERASGSDNSGPARLQADLE